MALCELQQLIISPQQIIGLNRTNWKRGLSRATFCAGPVQGLRSGFTTNAALVSSRDKQADAWIDSNHDKMFSCCEPDKKLRVAVLVSGGVDSSVALRLLSATGHSCTAFYLKIWFQDDFENFWSACPWEEDLKYAQQVCDQAGVKLEVVNLTEVYWSRVVSRCISDVQVGRTPNPDMLCNSIIKFGAFLEHIDRNNFDRVASGHYARVEQLSDENGERRSALKLSKDEIKDQTYFLSQLSQDQMKLVMFPLGCLKKSEVRALAEEMDLPNKDRKDSQGICFLGKVKFSEFISRHLGEKEGPLVEAETGKIMGKHRGFWFYTTGQRRGLNLSKGPWYVVAKDTLNNVVYISRNYFSGDKQRRSFHVNGENWLSSARPEENSLLRCKVRHGPRFYDCKLEHQSPGIIVRLTQADQALAPGQYAAFYDCETCLGSAIITDALDDLESCTVSSRSLQLQLQIAQDEAALQRPEKVPPKRGLSRLFTSFSEGLMRILTGGFGG